MRWHSLRVYGIIHKDVQGRHSLELLWNFMQPLPPLPTPVSPMPCMQEEYRQEQLTWTFIHFPDNGECITLIEKKPNGIIPTLDEQCLIGMATDDRFARELYKKSESNSR